MIGIKPQRPLTRLPGERQVPLASGGPCETDERLDILRSEGKGPLKRLDRFVDPPGL